MCRLMAYLGDPLPLEELLYTPAHSLIVQSYQPQEMTEGLLNADGFGIGWYHADRSTLPFCYKNVLPIWNDINLIDLARYVNSHCIVAYVRSATPGLAVDLGNCQPFKSGALLAIHNGYIEDFRQTLYRPMREKLCDRLYQSIHGTTDSEHLFVLLLQFLDQLGGRLNDPEAVAIALDQAIQFTFQLAQPLDLKVGATMILSTGTHLIVSRAANKAPVPSLYWLQQDQGVLIASEPLIDADWQSLPEQSITIVSLNGPIHTQPL